MNSKYTFYVTLVISVIVQLLTGILDVAALFVNVPSKFYIIRQLLILELVVQIIEGSFYAWLVYNFNSVTDVTPKRYIDWSITTPTMLVELIIYIIFLNNREKNTTSCLELFDLLGKNANVITYILLLNWLMLIFGYLGEKNILPNTTSVILGFIPFLIYYLLIFINYVKTKMGAYIFSYFFIFWSLYGLVALLPYYIKNALYNILDLFAKNFFGLFLSYIIIKGKY
jgi:hypothetical protein